MAIETLERVLKEHPFLCDLNPEHIETLVGCASNRRFAGGEYLSREGEKADEFFLIRAGQVALETYVPQRGGLRLETLHEGDVLGWSWLVEPYRWHFDARAVSQVRALALDGKCLRQKCETDHELGYRDIKAWESRHGRIANGSILVAQGGLSLEGAKYLVKYRDVAAIGSDTPVSSSTAEILLKKGLIAWTLTNLDRLPATGVTIVVGPDRVVARLPEKRVAEKAPSGRKYLIEFGWDIPSDSTLAKAAAAGTPK